GVVGSGVIKIVEEHQEELFHQVGQKVSVDKVLVRNMDKAREIEFDHSILTTESSDVIDNPDIDVIVEVMGGIDTAKEYILRYLNAKKHVITANNDFLAYIGQE